jgi:hypothetical protein
MEKLKKAALAGYCIGLAGMVFPQFFYMKFGRNFFPPYPGLPWLALWTCLFTLFTLTACVYIFLNKKAVNEALILGALLLAMFFLGFVPYELFVDPNNKHLGSWADGLKELALSGGAFVIAGVLRPNSNVQKTPFLKSLEKLIPFGKIFFCTTMVAYGYAHFLYTQPISTLVPNWIPGHIFWTYFAGAALMASGLAIVFNIKRELSALLLSATILIWLIVLHIPMAVADPYGQNANSVIAAFSALAFSAIAFLIAYSVRLEKFAKSDLLARELNLISVDSVKYGVESGSNDDHQNAAYPVEP